MKCVVCIKVLRMYIFYKITVKLNFATARCKTKTKDTLSLQHAACNNVEPKYGDQKFCVA